VVRIGGACGPPPPVAAPLVPRCALLTGATPRDELGRRRTGQIAPRLRLGPYVLSALVWLGSPNRGCAPRANAGPVREPSTGWRDRGWTVLPLGPCSSRLRRRRADRAVRRRLSTSRGVAPVRSAQRGTSGAATGGGGPQAPPIRTTYKSRTCSSLTPPRSVPRAESEAVACSHPVRVARAHPEALAP
jgi:hypothetical protein